MTDQALKHPAYFVSWTEYESGWGARPDGQTVHSTREVANAYIKLREANDSHDYADRADHTPQTMSGLSRNHRGNESC